MDVQSALTNKCVYFAGGLHSLTNVTVVLLTTFEALVVALVADVVLATYTSRHANRKATKTITPVHSKRESLGKI